MYDIINYLTKDKKDNEVALYISNELMFQEWTADFCKKSCLRKSERWRRMSMWKNMIRKRP